MRHSWRENSEACELTQCQSSRLLPPKKGRFERSGDDGRRRFATITHPMVGGDRPLKWAVLWQLDKSKAGRCLFATVLPCGGARGNHGSAGFGFGRAPPCTARAVATQSPQRQREYRVANHFCGGTADAPSSTRARPRHWRGGYSFGTLAQARRFAANLDILGVDSQPRGGPFCPRNVRSKSARTFGSRIWMCSTTTCPEDSTSLSHRFFSIILTRQGPPTCWPRWPPRRANACS